jgi:hypothetical protein
MCEINSLAHALACWLLWSCLEVALQSMGEKEVNAWVQQKNDIHVLRDRKFTFVYISGKFGKFLGENSEE